jgi:endonuclease YncB( thermonuclease family)
MDLLNTEAYCNCARAFTDAAEKPGSLIEIRAAKRIVAGDELTWPYHSDVARVDLSLMLYGMVNGTDTRLAGVDLPRRARGGTGNVGVRCLRAARARVVSRASVCVLCVLCAQVERG